ncbi:putative rhamnogalacturonan acetylesterase [Elsinoe ampelina]|uniref:Putative rhamnogalacturonan acetylesterase n=1 Tax=Elsinoe ampelina TaxID=302913 RepID=A0A6A6GKB6_9PEZI|nr:putative rhamnogalacturonan acetylesterase [Elsinoe ampelina]
MLAITSFLALAATTLAAPTVYTVGDSTMAKNGGGAGWSDGWGQYLGYSLSIPVVNRGVAGRSARSYNREGRFIELLKLVKKGDYAIIELGHNDGGSLTPTDNGRSNCPGTGAETCKTTYNGVAETVYTFNAVIEAAAKNLTAKGVTVILSSQTPNNPDETGSFSYTPSRFVGYMKLAADRTKNVYVDHGNYTAQAYRKLPVATVNSYFPKEHTHTSPAGADVVAKAFVKGLSCGSSPLKGFIKNATLPGSCL